jgi:hypothetical protein
MAIPQVPYVLGRLGAAYFNEANIRLGDNAGPGDTIQDMIDTWLALSATNSRTIEADNLADVDYDIGSDFADGTTRATAREGFASNIPVIKNGQVTFEMRWLPLTDRVPAAPYTFTELLIKAWSDGSTLGMVFLDYPINGNPGAGYTIAPQGLAANWSVSLQKSEGLRDVQKASVTLSASDTAAWYIGLQIVGT